MVHRVHHRRTRRHRYRSKPRFRSTRRVGGWWPWSNKKANPSPLSQPIFSPTLRPQKSRFGWLWGSKSKQLYNPPKQNWVQRTASKWMSRSKPPLFSKPSSSPLSRSKPPLSSKLSSSSPSPIIDISNMPKVFMIDDSLRSRKGIPAFGWMSISNGTLSLYVGSLKMPQFYSTSTGEVIKDIPLRGIRFQDETMEDGTVRFRISNIAQFNIQIQLNDNNSSRIMEEIKQQINMS